MLGMALFIQAPALAPAHTIVVPSDPRTPHPALVVDGKSEIRRALKQYKIKFEQVLAPELAEAEDARRSFFPYVKAEIARATDGDRKQGLEEVLASIDTFFWQCGGFKRSGERLLFCTVVRFWPPFGPGATFPDTGRTRLFCWCIFRPRDQHFSRLEWIIEG